MAENLEEIIAINPGSTSTKLGLFRADEQLCAEALRHETSTLEHFRTVQSQLGFRLQAARLWSRARVEKPSAVVAVGGLLRPLPGGTYRVNERMLEDARANMQGEHASNLGCLMASGLAAEFGCGAYVVDPVSVDEFEALARYSGHPLIQRRSLSHALNIHFVARRAAKEVGLPLEQSSFIVAHLGGGISVAPVHGGRIIDVNDASSGGPFSPERTGSLPLQEFITLCFSGSYSQEEVRALVMGKGGLVAYMGTNSAERVEAMISSGDTFAREIYEAMAYQIAKEIGAMATVLAGNLTAIVLTGGLAASTMLTGWITERVKFLAPILLYPGEDELRALALSALRVLRGEEQAMEY